MSIKLRLPSIFGERTHSPQNGGDNNQLPLDFEPFDPAPEVIPGTSLQAYATALLQRLMAAHPLPYQPKLEWRSYRVTAGMAYWKLGTIGLSRQVLQTEIQVRDTLIHEYAHLLAVARAGANAANHGPHWQQAMRDLGAPPVVRHTYEVTRNRPRQVTVYRCLKCGKEFERARRLPKRRRYQHANCGGGLKLVAVKRITPGNSP